jgi:DNA-binding transcriptional ArsR family regulator
MTMTGLDAFQALADPSRRQMLHLLARKSHTINSLAENFDMSRPAVSKHVKVLEGAGFITIQDIGRERHCLLNQAGFNEIQQWIDFYQDFWKSKLKKLEDLLDKKAKGH